MHYKVARMESGFYDFKNMTYQADTVDFYDGEDMSLLNFKPQTGAGLITDFSNKNLLTHFDFEPSYLDYYDSFEDMRAIDPQYTWLFEIMHNTVQYSL